MEDAQRRKGLLQTYDAPTSRSEQSRNDGSKIIMMPTSDGGREAEACAILYVVVFEACNNTIHV